MTDSYLATSDCANYSCELDRLQQQQQPRLETKKSKKSYYSSGKYVVSLSASLVFILFTLIAVGFGQEISSKDLNGYKSINPDNLRPILIGFRCDDSGFLETNGVCVIEADKQATLILYGEMFTTGTIIAFTPQPLRPRYAEMSHRKSQSSGFDTSLVAAEQPNQKNKFSPSESRNFSPEDTKHFHPRPRNFVASSKKREDFDFDCTDNNRLASIPLTSENILSQNVAQITIRLPELSSSSGGLLYYYFCIKQSSLASNLSSAKMNNTSNDLQTSRQQFQDVGWWIHQGDDWWLTLKVEPPILSMANDCLLIGFLLFLSAVTSGLNLGLMSLDMNELAVISSCGDQRERSYARTIAPLRKRGNYLLCSLLLGNVLVNSTLTVILEKMTSGLIAIIASTLAIVILGEIVPQAFCARQGLAIGAKTIYLTYAFMILTFPLSYPISRLLDWVLGEEKGNVYDRERLMEFIKITGHHTQLDAEEVAIISGALKLKKIKVDSIMTRIEDVFMLPIDCKLDRETLKRIIEKGYSRIPVYEFNDRKQIIALILAKDLALIDPDDHTPIASMLMYCKHPLIFIEDNVTLDVALNEFKTGKSHMAVVRQIYDDGEVDKYYEAIGVVTLEDVIEELLQTEINDETDTLSDNRRKRRRPNAQVAHLFKNDLFTTTNSQATGNLSSASISNIYTDSSQQNQHQQQTINQQQQQQQQLVGALTSTNLMMLEHGRGQDISQQQQQHQHQHGIDALSNESEQELNSCQNCGSNSEFNVVVVGSGAAATTADKDAACCGQVDPNLNRVDNDDATATNSANIQTKIDNIPKDSLEQAKQPPTS